jgi:hypothetical protein
MNDQRAAPIIDLLAGGFFLLWAVIGWISYAGNAALRKDLGVQADPGPALVPLIVLTLLSFGGVFFVGTWIFRTIAADTGQALPPATAHILPIGFAVSLGALVIAMPVTGFFPAGVAFCLLWLWVLSSRSRRFSEWVWRLFAAIAISGGIYIVFAHVLSVPLPG